MLVAWRPIWTDRIESGTQVDFGGLFLTFFSEATIMREFIRWDQNQIQRRRVRDYLVRLF
jgi:hypothetical protein